MGEAVTPVVGTRRARTTTIAVVVTASTLAILGLSTGPVVLSRASVAVGVAAVGILLLSVDVLHRHVGPGLPWRTLLLRAVGVTVLLLPLFVSAGAAPLPTRLRETVDQRPLPQLRSSGDQGFAQTVDYVLFGLLILLVLWLVLWSGVLGVLVRRIRLVAAGRRQPTPGAAGEPVGPDDATRATARSEALRRSAAALTGGDDARAAVIAAYVVLERHLEQVTPRGATETAHEFVARALRHGAHAGSEHVDALLEVFGAARFSALPISEHDADRARGHLSALVGG